MIPPEPDPPTPVTTYSFTADITYFAGSYANVPYTLTLSYKEAADSDWVVVDTADVLSKLANQTDSVVLSNIPEGCHSVKLEMITTTTGGMKNAGSSSWVKELTYGSGNEGWNQDYTSAISVLIYNS